MGPWSGKKIKIPFLILFMGFFLVHEAGAWQASRSRRRHATLKISQYVNIDNSADWQTSRTLTVPASAAGNLLVLVFVIDGTNSLLSLTDNKSNTWVSASEASQTNYRAGIWYAKASVSGTTTLNLTFDGGYHSFWYFEISGASATAPLVSTSNKTSTGTSMTANSVTTSDKAFIVSVSGVSQYVTGVGSPFTLGTLTNGHNIGYLLPSVPGTFAPVFAQSPSGTWTNATASFQ
jgi:hypothetical protein